MDRITVPYWYEWEPDDITDNSAPPADSRTCAKCKGRGIIPLYSFTEMQYDATDCPKCGGEGWTTDDIPY